MRASNASRRVPIAMPSARQPALRSTRRPSCPTVVCDSNAAPAHNMIHAEFERIEGGDRHTIFAVIGPGRRPVDATSAGYPVSLRGCGQQTRMGRACRGTLIAAA
jgi:hypothetical protein